jgi:hypothetical protein
MLNAAEAASFGSFGLPAGMCCHHLALDLTANIMEAPGELMPEIMIRCPTFGTAVQTGLRTETIIFESIIEDLSIPMDCPACLKVHRSQRRDAWVDTGNGHNRSSRWQRPWTGLNSANGFKSIQKDE